MYSEYFLFLFSLAGFWVVWAVVLKRSKRLRQMNPLVRFLWMMLWAGLVFFVIEAVVVYYEIASIGI